MDAKIGKLFNRELGDAKVRSIAWTDEDLVIEFSLPGQVTRTRQLSFKWVRHVKINLDYGDYVGQPLLFSVEAKQEENGTSRIRLEFGAAPEGEISFECNEIVEGGG
jgi:hypothetical protein